MLLDNGNKIFLIYSTNFVLQYYYLLTWQKNGWESGLQGGQGFEVPESSNT